jgi:hypothetical protein
MDEVGGRQIHKGKMNVMWNGAWVELGEAEFLVEDGRIVKVVSYTPATFQIEGSDSDGEAL